MKYLGDSFSIVVGSKEYRDNWDRIFKKDSNSEEEDVEKVKTPVKPKKMPPVKTKKKTKKK